MLRTTALIGALLSLTVAAQTVQIPDEDLQVFLHGKCAACMDTVSGLMDVALWNSAPVGLNIPLSLPQDGHLDLTGIDQLIIPFMSFDYGGGAVPTVTYPAYPQGLTGMDVARVDFDQFPDVATLPSGFAQFGCYSCGLSDIPPFQSLSVLQISGCDLSAGANVVPATLSSLSLNYCDLAVCPSLPNGLTTLILDGNNLIALSPLPASLNYLSAVLNDLVALPDLPPSLGTLSVFNNAITALPDLPATLATLNVSYNPITVMPTLPTGLTSLGVSGTLLQTPFDALPAGLLFLAAGEVATGILPPVLPSGLEQLLLNYAGITSMPDLPATLQRLDVSGAAQLQCLPLLPEGLTQLQAASSGLTCLPNIPASLIPNLAYIGMPANVCDPAVTLCELLDPVVTGTVFNDLDNDGVWDGNEPPRPNTNVRTTPGNILTASGTDGRYVLPIPTGPYAVNGVPVPYNTITTAAHNVNLTGPAQIDSLNDIGYHPTPGVFDLVVSAIASTAMVPGFAGDVWFTVKNIGTEPTSAEITFTLDPVLTWQGAVPEVSTLNGNTGTWSIPSIAPGERLSFAVVCYTDPAVAMGTPLVCQATALPAQTDVTPLDNLRLLNGITVSSYDPNDKRVVPETLTPAEVAAGTRVTYTIRFQNTGTAPAQRVVIRDTLRTSLQRPTFEFLGSSHPCRWYMLRGTVYFIFDDIDLPDSTTDEAASHGYVQFSIIPRTDLQLGAQVPNEAYIYFDFNPPILTAPALLTVESSTAIGSSGDREPGGVEVWPNPATNILFVQGADGHVAEVSDLTGRLVMRQRLPSAPFGLDVSGLVAGGYVLRLVDGRAAAFMKR